MVIEEAKISRKFSLFIRLEDLETEILFWLTFVNQVGPKTIRNSDWDEIWRLASDVKLGTFAEISRYYFDLIKNSKPKITSANTAFDCHLQAVQTRILKCLADDKFPLA